MLKVAAVLCLFALPSLARDMQRMSSFMLFKYCLGEQEGDDLICVAYIKGWADAQKCDAVFENVDLLMTEIRSKDNLPLHETAGNNAPQDLAFLVDKLKLCR